MMRPFAALAVLVLAGCQATYVDHLPEGATTRCQPEWRGAWIGIEDDGRDADTGVLVAESCRVTVIPGDPGPKDKELDLVPTFVPDTGIVLFARTEVAEVVDEASMAAMSADETWLPFQWSRTDDDVLILRAPDHRRIATLIVNGAFDGFTQWSGEGGFNVIRGEPADIRRRLVEDRLFTDENAMKLRRVGDDRKAVMRALKKAVRAKERRS